MGPLADFISRRWRGLSPAVRAALISAVVVGLIGHVSFLTNRFFNHDTILYTLVDTNSTFGLQQGKWFSLPVGLLMHGKIITSNVVLTVGILVLSVVAALTVSTLGIRSPLWGALTGAFLVLFPSVMSTTVFESTALFFAALLMAAIAVYVTVRWRRGFWLGIIMLTLSCGTYSVYIGYAAGMFLIVELFRLLDGKTPIRTILLDGLKYLLVLAASAALYYAILELLLRVSQVGLMDYRGIDQISSFTLTSVITYTAQSYRKVLYFFFYGIFLYRGSFSIEPLFLYMNWATLALSGILTVWIAIRSRAYRNIWRLLLTIMLMLLFPIAIHAIGILGKSAYTHWIMVYPFVLVYVYMLACADQTERFGKEQAKSERAKRFSKTAALSSAIAVLLVALLLCRQWYFTTSQSYEYLRYTNENTYAAGILLVDDMRETEGYSEGTTPVALVGSGAPTVFQYSNEDFSAIAAPDGSKYTGLRLSIVDHERLKALLRNWIGVAPAYATDAQTEQLSALPQVANMPVYPAAGSIAMINGYLVVKLSPLTTAG